MMIAITIPPPFRSDDTMDLLRQCMVCEKELIDSNSQYLIEKSFVKPLGVDVHETLFEYAICMECAMQMRQQLSTASLERMDRFMQQGLQHDFRHLPDYLAEPEQLEQWLSACAFSGQLVSDLLEYQIMAVCQGDQMLVAPDAAYQRMPLLIGGPTMDKLVDLLSEETKEELDRFRELLGGVPPEWEEVFKGRPVIV